MVPRRPGSGLPSPEENNRRALRLHRRGFGPSTVADQGLIPMPATRSIAKERAKAVEADVNRAAHEAQIARRDARTLELRALRLERDAALAEKAKQMA